MDGSFSKVGKLQPFQESEAKQSATSLHGAPPKDCWLTDSIPPPQKKVP